MKTLRIFIGYDPKEAVAFHVLCHSLLERSSKPISITPINLKNLKGLYSRPHDQRQSNEFSFSRFLVPYLCDFKGIGVYMDCDMLALGDISAILDEIDDNHAVSVVKHDYESKVKVKYLGNKQYSYPRKNWSSFIVWNCNHPSNRAVDPKFIGDADAATLHRFLWLKDEEIGGLSLNWNWLVGEYDKPSDDINVLHWTLGGPYFKEYLNTDFSDEWTREFKSMTFCKQHQ
tara:strand:- start:194 stop:883 length:690 start_codon:yes stop_codon:yes gene_type:complete